MAITDTIDTQEKREKSVFDFILRYETIQSRMQSWKKKKVRSSFLCFRDKKKERPVKEATCKSSQGEKEGKEKNDLVFCPLAFYFDRRNPLKENEGYSIN